MTAPKPPPESRESYSEIAALLASLAKTFAITDAEAAAAIESGAITLSFGADDAGNRFVVAGYQGTKARIYRDAIKHAPTPPKDSEKH